MTATIFLGALAQSLADYFERVCIVANEEHLKILNQGVESWNHWLEDNPDVVPDLSHAILLNTDFRTTKELTQEQLEGDNPPFICNSPLPEGMAINCNRDCDLLAPVLQK